MYIKKINIGPKFMVGAVLTGMACFLMARVVAFARPSSVPAVEHDERGIYA
jgi:hypothetical protein